MGKELICKVVFFWQSLPCAEMTRQCSKRFGQVLGKKKQDQLVHPSKRSPWEQAAGTQPQIWWKRERKMKQKEFSWDQTILDRVCLQLGNWKGFWSERKLERKKTEGRKEICWKFFHFCLTLEFSGLKILIVPLWRFFIFSQVYKPFGVWGLFPWRRYSSDRSTWKLVDLGSYHTHSIFFNIRILTSLPLNIPEEWRNQQINHSLFGDNKTTFRKIWQVFHGSILYNHSKDSCTKSLFLLKIQDAPAPSFLLCILPDINSNLTNDTHSGSKRITGVV